jgi:hypothetical protein
LTGVTGAALTGLGDALCPCGGGKPDHACSPDAQGCWSPKRLAIRQPGGRTGKRGTRCYAASFWDCDGALSGEHYVPDCVIRSVAESPIPKASPLTRISPPLLSRISPPLC